MILPILTFIHNRKHTATPRKPAPVELRLAYNRRSYYISTGITILTRHWHSGTILNRPDAPELNDTLAILLQRVRQILNDLPPTDNLPIAEIRARLRNADTQHLSFLTFIQQRADIRAYNRKTDTQQRYARFLRWFTQWGQITTFTDITEQNIMAMDTALAATGMKPYSKWNNYHRFLNSFIIDAIDEGHIRRNPYRSLHIDKDKQSTLHKFLTAAELEAIATATMPTASLDKVRDLFIFQTYTCLAYTDLAAFRPADIDAQGIYTANRGKTGQEFTVAILPQAQTILDKYHGHLPIISNVKYNAYLKLVAQAANIDKPITSHWARHTGATLLLNAGIPYDVVAKILGHASIKQTRDTYAKLLDTTILQQMQKLK